MLKKVLNILFYIFTTFLMVVVILELVAPSKTIDLIGFKGYSVATPSMEPIIKVGDIIIIVKADLDNLKADDIISFYADLNGDGIDEVVTHAIREIVYEDEVRLFRTYGINNTSDDLYHTTDEDIVGSYLFRVPFLGYVVLFINVMFRNPILLGLVILNITIIIILVKFIKKKPEVTS